MVMSLVLSYVPEALLRTQMIAQARKCLVGCSCEGSTGASGRNKGLLLIVERGSVAKGPPFVRSRRRRRPASSNGVGFWAVGNDEESGLSGGSGVGLEDDPKFPGGDGTLFSWVKAVEHCGFTFENYEFLEVRIHYRAVSSTPGGEEG